MRVCAHRGTAEPTTPRVGHCRGRQGRPARLIVHQSVAFPARPASASSSRIPASGLSCWSPHLPEPAMLPQSPAAHSAGHTGLPQGITARRAPSCRQDAFIAERLARSAAAPRHPCVRERHSQPAAPTTCEALRGAARQSRCEHDRYLSASPPIGSMTE